MNRVVSKHKCEVNDRVMSKPAVNWNIFTTFILQKIEWKFVIQTRQWLPRKKHTKIPTSLNPHKEMYKKGTKHILPVEHHIGTISSILYLWSCISFTPWRVLHTNHSIWLVSTSSQKCEECLILNVDNEKHCQVHIYW